MFPGRVERFPADARVPHMGWNTVSAVEADQAARNGEPYVYFAHSYYVPVCDRPRHCEYALPYTAVLESGNVFGVQFHPEKSGRRAFEIVRKFVELHAG